MNEITEAHELPRLWNVAGAGWPYNEAAIPPEPEEPKEGEEPPVEEVPVILASSFKLLAEEEEKEEPEFPPAECDCKCECSCPCEPPVFGEEWGGCKCKEREWLEGTPEGEGLPECDCNCKCVKVDEPPPYEPPEPVTPIPKTFRGINNGELPDSESFIIVSDKLTTETMAVYGATDGNVYVAGNSEPYQDTTGQGLFKWPRRAELITSIASAEETLKLMHTLEAKLPISPSVIKEIHDVHRHTYDVYFGWTDEGAIYRYVELNDGTILMNGFIYPPDSIDKIEFNGIATDMEGTPLTEIVAAQSYRVFYYGQWALPLLLDNSGNLWAPAHNWNGIQFQKIAEGVTHMAQESETALVILKEGRLYRAMNLQRFLQPEPPEPLVWRKISGDKTLEKLFSNSRALEMSDVYNLFAIEPDGTMWVKGTNAGGALGVPDEGDLSIFTRTPTASKVEDVISRDSFTFIKKRE